MHSVHPPREHPYYWCVILRWPFGSNEWVLVDYKAHKEHAEQVAAAELLPGAEVMVIHQQALDATLTLLNGKPPTHRYTILEEKPNGRFGRR